MPVKFKQGNEPFLLDGGSAGFNLGDFWQWSASDLLSNLQRGTIAEYIVGKALGTIVCPRNEWDGHDIETANGQRVEIKSAAYYQRWSQPDDPPSAIGFDIAPRHWTWDDETNGYKWMAEGNRFCDLYVFCVLGSPKDDRAFLCSEV